MIKDLPYKRQREIAEQTKHPIGCECQTCKWTSVSISCDKVVEIYDGWPFNIFRCR